MFRLKMEKLKTAILIALVLSSIVQVGILWGIQNRGLPIFVKPKTVYTSQSVQEEFFKPYKIVACDRDQTHWLMDRSEDAVVELWNETKDYLTKIIDDKKYSVVDAEVWGAIIQRPGFVFEFACDINRELFKWFLNKKSQIQAGPTSVFKIAIQPQLDTASDTLNLYILDNNEKKIYGYKLDLSFSKWNTAYYSNFLVKLARDIRYQSRAYKTAYEVGFENQKYKVNSDILMVTSNVKPSTRSYPSIQCNIPAIISKRDEVTKLIPEDENNYSRSYSEDIVLWNSDNTYTIKKDGSLLYKYIPNYTGELVSIGKSFLSASELINRIRRTIQLKDTEIYLSGIETHEEGKYYIFTFDYITMDIPLYFSNQTGSEGIRRKNAIRIKASGRVIECEWILRDIAVKDNLYEFNLRTDKILEAVSFRTNNIHIQDMGLAYRLQNNDELELLPSWVISMRNNENIFIPLKEGG